MARSALRLRPSRWALLLGALVIAIGAAVVAVGIANNSPAVAAAHKTYFAQSGNGHRAVIRPRTLLISGDGTLWVAKMTWSRWVSRRADGRGTSVANTCNPNCAQGHLVRDPVVVHLSRPHHKCGRWFFNRVVLHYPKTHPKFFKATEVFSPFGLFC
ncbi:MAG: hypothetical protein ACXVEU_12130 [Nocardioidaceae bacterium]